MPQQVRGVIARAKGAPITKADVAVSVLIFMCVGSPFVGGFDVLVTVVCSCGCAVVRTVWFR